MFLQIISAADFVNFLLRAGFRVEKCDEAVQNTQLVIWQS